MARFVDRADELAALERWWANPDGRFGIVWGRRRVGKTMLVQRFARDKRTIFHTGAGRPVADELRVLSEAAAGLGLKSARDLRARPFADWDDALDWLSDQSTEGPILLVLDEFPELVAATPALPGILRAFADRQRDIPLRILVCGSAVRTMEAMQEERAPLYGRFSLSLHLHPFKPHESALMLSSARHAERAVIWGILGGVPLYLSMWEQADTILGNLERLFCSPGAPLLLEGELLLATEADLTGLGGRAVRAIATGRTRHNEIAAAIGVEPSRVLARLIELGLVEQVVPVTQNPARAKRKIYRISDNSLAFWLSQVEPHRSQIDRGLGPAVARLIERGLDDAMGRPWEDAFRRHLTRLAASGELGEDVVAIGQWWNADSSVEIDAVALAGRSRTPVLVGEAKWARTEDGGKLVADLIRKGTAVPGIAGDVRYAVCAREKVTNVPSGVLSVSARDIFSG